MSKKLKKYELPSNIFDSYNDAIRNNPTWSFDAVDVNLDKWNFFKNANESILLQLKSFEGMTWFDIEKTSGGRVKGTNNHFVKISELSKEARQEIRNLKYIDDKICSLFSLRLSGKTRMYGIREETTGLFKIIWLDFNHEIYCIKK